MKILALVTVALIALGSTANAKTKVVKQLPYKMTGEWCFKDVNKSKETYYTEGKCKEVDDIPSDGNIVLSSMRLEFYETACNINKIKKGVAAEFTYIVEMNCSGEGETWNERVQIRFQPFPSLLFIKELGNQRHKPRNNQ